VIPTLSKMALSKTPAEEAFGVSLPHRRMEEWRWTDLRARLAKPYPPHQNVVVAIKDVERLIASSPFAKITNHRIVFVNGCLDQARSNFVGLTFELGVPSSSTVDDPVIHLNSAIEPAGLTLRFEAPMDVPVELIHITTSGAARAMALRNRIEVGEGASATLIETFLGEGDYVMNAVTEINLGVGARLDRVKVELESHDATHLSYVDVTLAKDAKLNEFTLTSGAALNRQNGNYLFDGEYANGYIAGAYLLNGKQHADTCLVMDHKVPHCTSREMFKCVMDESARGIFQGKVIVRKHAQKTDGKQSSHALLLSESAEFDAKPELEIFADDVVCGHGATAGDINHDHLFYLQSRGIPEAEAKSLLIGAFVGEAFDAIVNDAMREAMVSFAENWLTQRKAK
jgi:Fe-S cluster assembly protein SufD